MFILVVKCYRVKFLAEVILYIIIDAVFSIYVSKFSYLIKNIFFYKNKINLPNKTKHNEKGEKKNKFGTMNLL